MRRVRRRRPPSHPPTEWPAVLRRVIRAAQRECPAGHGDTLRDMIAMALLKMPARGIFDPAVAGEHELYAAIDASAKTHLSSARARATWQTALDAAGLEATLRDNIEVAAVEVRHISDSAYYYAGLAFGLVFASRSTL